MSKFSGKCDVYDWFSNRDEEYISNGQYYLCLIDKRHRLDIHCRKDLIPYYPHLVVLGYHSGGHSIVWITPESYVDTREEEHIDYCFGDILKEWNRCKRKKITFDPNEIYEKYSTFYSDVNMLKEIIKRVAADGNNANIDNIHSSFYEYYRKILFDEMIKWGYSQDEANQWVYGFTRWMFNENKTEEKADTETQ